MDLLPVTVGAPAQEITQSAPAPVASAAPAGAVEISVGNTRGERRTYDGTRLELNFTQEPEWSLTFGT